MRVCVCTRGPVCCVRESIGLWQLRTIQPKGAVLTKPLQWGRADRDLGTAGGSWLRGERSMAGAGHASSLGQDEKPGLVLVQLEALRA